MKRYAKVKGWERAQQIAKDFNFEGGTYKLEEETYGGYVNISAPHQSKERERIIKRNAKFFDVEPW